MNATTYLPLEPSYTSILGENARAATFSTSQAVDLFASTSFLYSLGIMIIVVAAAWRYGLAGIWRMQASERGQTKSNEELKRVTLGLLGVLSLFTILYTVNKGLLKGDIDLKSLRSQTTAGVQQAMVQSTGSNTASRSCENTSQVISSLSSPGGICGGTSCTVLSDCSYNQYVSTIKAESQRQGVDPRLAVAIMCTESRGRVDAKNHNPNGTWDCGLMQVNQAAECSPSSLEPNANIAAGIAHIKRVLGSATQIYRNIPAEAGIAATYNCCANGTIPNAPSADCTTAAGFPYTIPKWACPINPGDGQYNMCSVKSYGCGVSACIRDLSGVL
jgi:hypothetical protein